MHLLPWTHVIRANEAMPGRLTPQQRDWALRAQAPLASGIH
jgi:hypothetical protein